MMQFLIFSAENGWRVLGGSVSPKSVPVHEVLPGKLTILVLGSEGTGLRPLVERSCTHLVKFPGNTTAYVVNDLMRQRVQRGMARLKSLGPFLAVESLNVSVAAGVLLHHFIGKNSCRESVTE